MTGSQNTSNFPVSLGITSISDDLQSNATISAAVGSNVPLKETSCHGSATDVHVFIDRNHDLSLTLTILWLTCTDIIKCENFTLALDLKRPNQTSSANVLVCQFFDRRDTVRTTVSEDIFDEKSKPCETVKRQVYYDSLS